MCVHTQVYVWVFGGLWIRWCYENNLSLVLINEASVMQSSLYGGVRFFSLKDIGKQKLYGAACQEQTRKTLRQLLLLIYCPTRGRNV